MKEIILYGTERCHKTKYYQEFFNTLNLDFTFLDVEENEVNAETLRSLYVNQNLNFHTITIDSKKLRNPSEKELNKWLVK